MNAVLLAVLSTSAGGLCALRFRDRLHLVLGIAAGVLLGVVAFDLLPESFELSQQIGSDGHAAMVALACGFLLFHGLEKFVLVHSVHAADYAAHTHPRVGVLSAVALVAHSFVDGIGIGLAFQVSPAVGFTVLVIYLGFFAGFLLYIGAADILPQAHSCAGSAASMSLIGLTALGVVSIYAVSLAAR